MPFNCNSLGKKQELKTMPCYGLDFIVVGVIDYLERDGGRANCLDMTMLGLMAEMGMPEYSRFQRWIVNQGLPLFIPVIKTTHFVEKLVSYLDQRMVSRQQNAGIFCQYPAAG